MPNRILKESICTSDNLDSLSTEAEAFFYRLLVQCDDYGRMDARPPILLSRCYPLRLDRVTIAMVSQWLDQLRRAELITLYTVAGKPYLQFTTWDKHQQVRAQRSKYPALADGLIADDSNGNQLQSNVPVIQSNPIQSESESESESDTKHGADKPRKQSDDTCPKPWMDALYGLSKIDPSTATVQARKNVSDCGKALVKCGSTLDQVATFERNWYAADWRGKQGQAPTIKQVRDEWGKYSKPLSGNGHKPPTATPSSMTGYQKVSAL